MIRKIVLSRLFNALVLLACLGSLSAAWYYQYVLGFGPCVLCIHIRIIVVAIAIINLIHLFMPHNKLTHVIFFTSFAALALWLAERTFQTLGIERGWVEGACSMDLGFPSWFSIDTWWPDLFEAWEPCGYTPYIISNITMAESLMATAVVAVLVAITGLIAALAQKPSNPIRL